ncbi:MAG: DUF2723 domain-containing protein [Chloroflexota bacterium]|nr:DUF2723 domain-containing protein [Chloroflexota bacterium]
MLASGVGLVALGAYLPTLAPTITWRNRGVDSGDLAAAVASLGIPHPPGYPTYTLLGWAWTALPLGGDVAYRLNLLSAGSAALASGLAAVTVLKLGSAGGLRGPSCIAGGLAAGLAMAFAPLTWSQATIAEVYAPGLAVLSMLTLPILHWRRASNWRALLPVGLFGGLGLGVLPELALVAPGALGVLAARAGGRAFGPRRLLPLAAGAVVGLGVFAYLPLRAFQQPLVNWGAPTTLARFWQVVTAEQYRYLFRAPGPGEWTGRFLDSLMQLGHELSLVGCGLALVGAIWLWRRQRSALAYMCSLLGLAVLFRSSYVAEDNVVYLLPALYALVLLAGLGTARVVATLVASIGYPAGVTFAMVMLALLGLHASETAATLTLNGDSSANVFAQRMLMSLPHHAVVVSDRDETTFSLWYRQALGDRPDVVVVDSRLLFRDWYRHNLVERYPDLDPAAVRPGGLTALNRPVYALVGAPGRNELQPHPFSRWQAAAPVPSGAPDSREPKEQ